MHQLQQKGVEKVIDFLKAINCQYKVVDTDGNVFTNIPEGEVFKKRSASFYPLGVLTTHIRKHADHIGVGEVITIPKGEYDCDRIASTASSYFAKKFGLGSCTTHRTNNGVEVLRMF